MKILRCMIFGSTLVGAIVSSACYSSSQNMPKLQIPENSSEQKAVAVIDDWFEQLNSNNQFNGGVLILNEGQPVLAKTYGFTNATRNQVLDNHSSFRLGSLTKQFTASGIMLLAEQGKIKYEDYVSQYIPGFPYDDVTVRNLLNQTSGIPDVYIDLAHDEKDNIGVLTNKKAIDLLIKHKPKASFKHNDKFNYSNTNYIILARLIEIVSNQSFEDFMTTNVFVPLQMNDTRVWNLISKDTTFNGKTEGFKYINGKTEKIEPTFLDGVAGDGAVFSSINDFVIWDKFWYENPLINQSHLEEAFKQPILNNGELAKYGFGWAISNENEVWHTGAWLAARTYYYRDAESKTSIVLLDNSNNDAYFNEIIESLIKVL